MSEALINKYRPKTLDDVVGHSSVVQSLKSAIGAKTPVQTFLLTGPSGVGKTTIARILAGDLGCLPGDLVEIDAATHTGIDAMREVMESLGYQPLGKGKAKAVIVDECHALSKAAFQSLLKSLEEPPPWALWFLCTTEPQKVPAAIKTRSMHCALGSVGAKDLLSYLDKIAADEDILSGELRDDVVELCVLEAEGSPRQAISNLTACRGVSSTKEAQQALASVEGSAEAVELARALLKKAPWKEVQSLLTKLREVSPEGIRHVIRAYMTNVVLGAKSERAAGEALEILDAFSDPLHPQDGLSPIVLACGKVLWSNE